MSVSRATASALVGELFELQRVVHRILRTATEHTDLTTVQMSLLNHLASVPSRRAKDIGADSGLGASVISRQLSHLEKLGFVERAPDPQDGRAQLVRITRQGREALFAHLEANTQDLIDRLDPLSEDDVRRMRQDLNRLTDIFLTSLGLERMSTCQLPIASPRSTHPTTPAESTGTAHRPGDTVQ